MSYSQHILDQMPRKKTILYYISCCPAYFRAINLTWIQNKKQFFTNYQKAYDSTMIFGYIFKNVFNPLKLWSSQQLSFFCTPMMKHKAVIHFKINFKTTFYAFLLCEIGRFTQNFGEIERIHKMLSWQFFNRGLYY